MNKYEVALRGCPIYIVTKEFQIRKHHKKRINKKWRKRYGVYEWSPIPDGQVVFDKVEQVVYMTNKTYGELMRNCEVIK